MSNRVSQSPVKVGRVSRPFAFRWQEVGTSSRERLIPRFNRIEPAVKYAQGQLNALALADPTGDRTFGIRWHDVGPIQLATVRVLLDPLHFTC